MAKEHSALTASISGHLLLLGQGRGGDTDGFSGMPFRGGGGEDMRVEPKGGFRDLLQKGAPMVGARLEWTKGSICPPARKPLIRPLPPGMHWKRERYRPPPTRPAYAQPLSP